MKTITAKQAKEISDFRKENPVEWFIQDIFEGIIEIAKEGGVLLKYSAKSEKLTQEQADEIAEFFKSKGFSVFVIKSQLALKFFDTTIIGFNIWWHEPNPAEEDTEETDSQEEVNVFKTS